jgi:D-sedoheptulose 7-phosphate isomerase
MRPEGNGTSELRRNLEDLRRLLREVAESLEGEVESVARMTLETLRRGGRLFFCGNGGSAADAQHLAAEYVVRFQRKRRALPALALTTDTSVITACGNDFGFETVFARQLEALAERGDLLTLHSTSGESENLALAAGTARELGVGTVAFLARGGGRLAGMVDRAVIVPTAVTARAQEVHLALGHVICQMVEDRLGGTIHEPESAGG